jgi:archaellum component FlaG (FlaF/FlaG flagellin family)
VIKIIGSIPFSQLGQIHQYATVSAGITNQRVFYLKIPDSCVGFITRMASNWLDNIKFHFIIDGEIVERNIERQIGPMGDATKIDPPYLVKNYIEVKANNNDTVAHDLEVLIDGIAYHVKSIIL